MSAKVLCIVMSISTPLRSLDGAVAYYTRPKSEYYLGDANAPNGTWWGRGAERLGLTGPVGRSDFEAALSGRVAGLTLRPSPRGPATQARLGQDLTFNAPKSVSLVALLYGDAAVRDPHAKAVGEALAYHEAQVVCRRQVGPHRWAETTGNLIVARFEESTNRHLDPHLHTHCVVMNATQRGDGAWRSLLNEGAYAESRLLTRIYLSALARELKRAGYALETDPHAGTFEVAGFTADQLEAFSQSRAAILETMEAAGLEGGRAARTVAGAVRPTKRADPADLPRQWRVKASDWGLPSRAPRDARPSPRPDPTDSLTAAEAVAQAVAHLEERQTVLRAHEILNEALKRSLGQHDLAEVSTALEMHPGLRSAPQVHRTTLGDTGPAYVTERLLAAERCVVEVIQAGRDAVTPLAEPDARPERAHLTLGQRTVLDRVLASRDRVQVLQGYAGTGKTTLLAELTASVRAAGLEVRAMAPTATARDELRARDIPAETVARFLNASSHADDSPALWIVDEVSMLGTLDAAALLERAQTAGARVLFVGDRDQMPSVSAGSVPRLLQDSATTHRLTEIVRQAPETQVRAAVEALVEGDAPASLEPIRSQIEAIPHRERRLDRAAQLYLEDPKRTLLVTPTHRDRAALTARIRTRLEARGDLGGDDLTSTVLIPTGWTEAQRKDAASYQPGDVVLLRRGLLAEGVEPGTYAVVVEVEKDTLLLSTGHRQVSFRPSAPRSVEVFRPESRAFAVGDRLVWTRNDRRRGLTNGTRLEVTAVNPILRRLDVRTARRHLTLALDDPSARHLDHAYVSTLYGAQGRSADRVILHVPARAAGLGQEAWYVGLSRARSDRLHVLTDHLEDLPKALRRTLAEQVGLHAVGAAAPRSDAHRPHLRPDARRPHPRAVELTR